MELQHPFKKQLATERKSCSLDFLVTTKIDDITPILDVCYLTRCLTHKWFISCCKQLLEVVQQGNWFTTSDLKKPNFMSR